MGEILKADRNCWAIESARRAGVLVDGREYYRAFFRSAQEARHYILLAGWQFDSHESLVRGEDARGIEEDTRLLPFLDGLCRKQPQLRVYILAWDYSPIYLLDREWLQAWIVNWKTHERLQFRFDNQHAVGASHHQKFVVIDGRLAFVGGLDLCCSRWDDRGHLPGNPDRVNSDGTPYDPFHDVQSYLVGPVAERLTDHFQARWFTACGEELSFAGPASEGAVDIPSSLPLPAGPVAISRTQGSTLAAPDISIKEIRQLYLDAIDAAEELIYMENQYMSSQDIYEAFARRMRADGRGRLQIVILLPRRQSSFMETVALGIAQSNILTTLKELASETGHAFGVYYTASRRSDGEELPTYIHAKLMLVDDRFLSLGSANASNRSMGLDSELNVSWEAGMSDGEELRQSIRKIRVSLLAEHCGIGDEGGMRQLEEMGGLVEVLDRFVDGEGYRLRRHPMDTLLDHTPILNRIMPETLDLDPSQPVVEEVVGEAFSTRSNGIFASGITLLRQWLSTREPQPSGGEASAGEPRPGPPAGGASPTQRARNGGDMPQMGGALKRPFVWLVALTVMFVLGVLGIWWLGF